MTISDLCSRTTMNKVYSHVSIQSFSAKKLRAITEKLVQDTKHLRSFIHKIFKIRLLDKKNRLFYHLYFKGGIVHASDNFFFTAKFAALFSDLSGIDTIRVRPRTISIQDA
jgi:hypothetical protein